MSRATRRFREIVERPETTIAVGGAVPIHAAMVERAGFEVFHLGGTMFGAWMTGWADAGVLTPTEMVEQAARTAKLVDIPVFCDADTGGGSAVNVWRTTQEYVRAGVAGIHLEDQADPKLSGDRPGRRVLPLDEALGKIHAAIDAKDELDPDFVICARTDARGAEGGSLEEAVRRGRAFREEAGADLILYAELMSWDECVHALAETPGPAFCVLHPSGGQLPPIDVQQAAGNRLAIYPRVITDAANQAGWDQLMAFKERGGQVLADFAADVAGRPWRFDLEEFLAVDFARVREMEEAYYPERLRRDYGGGPAELPTLDR